VNRSAVPTRVVKFSIVAVLLSSFSAAQNASLTLSSGSGAPGSVVALTLSLNSSNPPAALAWTLTYATKDITALSVTPGSVTLAAGKSISCNNTAGVSTCDVWGINTNTISNGIVATIAFSLSAATNDTAAVIQLSNGDGASSGGSTVSTASVGSTITITQAPVISSPMSASGTVGSAFSYQIAATFSPTTFGATGLPAGLAVNSSTGLISGTPTSAAAGTWTVNISATNGSGTGNATLVLTIAGALPAITSPTSGGGTVGTPFSYQIAATNSPTSHGAASLPAGLSVNTSTGLISGTPTSAAAGTWPVTLSATNTNGTGNAPLTLTIQNASGGPAWYNSAWTHRKQVTILHGQVAGGSALTNFPILYSVPNDGNLAAEALASGDDILFTATDGLTKLNHQIESYNSTTGQLIAWVQIPSLSNNADTVIYMYYGNSGASNQQNPTTVWDSNYSAVWHLPNGTTLSANDSTANADNGTISSPTATAGEIGGGASFNGATDGIGFSPISNLVQTYTAEFWINSSFPNPYMTILGDSSGFNDIYFDNGRNVLGVDNGTSFRAYSTAIVSGMNVAANTWTAFAVTRSGSSVSVYENGALVGTGTFSTPYNVGSFSEMGNTGGINHYGGALDEVRISSSVRSAGWIQTEYNNESSPATFLSVGGEQTNSGTSSTVSITVTSAPAGLGLSVDSVSCTAPCNFQWNAASSHTIAVATSPQAGGAGTQYAYANWSDGLAQSHSITVPATAATYTANFTTQYLLTTSANPTASGIVSPASGWFNSGTPIDLTAIANSGYTLSGIAGTMSSSTSPLNFTMTGPMTETANFSVATGPGWYNSAWGHRKQITIAHGQVSGGSALTNFPMLYSVTSDAKLASEAQASGNDILFTASDGVTKLNHQIESYTSSTGQLIAWVHIPALSNSADTVIYIYYGNGAASNQQNPAAVWDSNYAAVWHLPNGTTLSAADSTAHGNNGAIVTPVATSGEIGGAASFNGSSDGITFNPINNLVQTYTAEFWINSSFPHPYMSMLGGTGAFNDIYFDNGHNVLGVDNGTSYSAYSTAIVSGLNVPSNTWTSLAVSRNGSSISVYKNGALVGTGTFSTPYNVLNFAEMGNAAGINYYGGKLDEVKISSNVRSAAWIQTEYNNQSSPSAFLTVGGEQNNVNTVAAPTFSVPGGTYSTAQTVSISSTTSGASIRYTTNGTAPSETVGTLYSGSVTVSSSETLMAIAYKSGLADSPVASASYAIGGSTGPTWYNASWSFRKPLTVNSGQVTGTLTNFPMLYSVTDANLVGNTQASGNDLLFTASDGVTKLNHQIESYNSATGTLVAWVSVPALQSGTVIYVYYGNASATNQQNPTAVWDWTCPHF